VPANEYHFITHWRVQGSVDEVASILGDAPSLKRWWPSVYLDVRELRPGDERGVGREIDLFTKGWLPYTLRWRFRTVESHFPYGFTIEAFGDFVGRGIWTLAQNGPWVDVTYDWKIRADKPLLRRFSRILKPIFSANHRWAMARGEESLRLELARRRAAAPEERARVPLPPQPTTSSPLPLLAALLIGTLAAGVAVALLVRTLRHRRAKPRRFGFDPDRVAYFEAAGWRAYYDRDWAKLFRLMVQLCQEQFRIPFPRSLQAAYHVARATAAWVPENHDVRKVRDQYERFYRLARRYSGLTFDPRHVAALEVAYNDVHRRLSGQPDKLPFVRTMTNLHSALFGIPPALARESAELRVLAGNVVDQITSKRSLDIEADWRLLEDYLRGCYRSLQRAMAVASG
jgi:hypothetical protein